MVKLGSHNFAQMEAWVARQHGRPVFLFWHTFETHNPYLETARAALPPETRERLRALGYVE